MQLTDEVWKPGMQLARPRWRIEHPILDNLGAKLVTSLWIITMTGFNHFSCLHQTGNISSWAQTMFRMFLTGLRQFMRFMARYKSSVD